MTKARRGGLVVTLLAALFCVFLSAPPAMACPPGQVPSSEGGHFCVPAFDPGAPGSDDPGDSGGPGSGGGQSCTKVGEKVPCYREGLGVWISSRQCYAQQMAPQPPPNSTVWAGNDPEKGAMWVCSTYDGPAVNGGWFYVADGDTPPSVDPGQLAAETLETMPMAIARPTLAPAEKTWVNLETWLWTPNPATWEPISKSATAGATTVTVVAAPTRVYWSLGDGSTMDCFDQGRPWTSGLGDLAETDCGYTYTATSAAEPGGLFKVTAAVMYQADWTCSGACTQGSGTLGEVAGQGRVARIEVGERQSVVVGGGS